MIVMKKYLYSYVFYLELKYELLIKRFNVVFILDLDHPDRELRF